MPQTELELFDRVIDLNRRACHHRGLRSKYGYEGILGVKLIEACLSMRRRFTGPIRVLDIGCGDGIAMQQLGEGLVKAGARPGDFELWGMGLNRYDEMFLPPGRFIASGLNAYEPDGTRFHLIVSVFTFHYMWHKLEGVTKLYNEMLEPGGRACLHFPGYLVRFGESPVSLAQSETEGNQLFSAFLSQQQRAGAVGPMSYSLAPYYSDDDDCVLLAEFGRLEVEKCRNEPIDFGQTLRAFALFTDGFKFSRMNHGALTYVASHYVATDSATQSARGMARPPYRIRSIPARIERCSFEVHLAVHAQQSDRVILMCPGACEPLAGKVLDLTPVTEQIHAAGLGAVVRYNDPYDQQGDFPELALEALRQVLLFIQEKADRFCSSSSPRIGIMAYSSSAGAAAALAAEFPQVDSLLLVAPSFDVPREAISSGLARYDGALYVLIGDADRVVLPQQAFWFYDKASRARHREYVELSGCGHYFEGLHNQHIFHHAPHWAFGGRRPDGFPAARTHYSMMA